MGGAGAAGREACGPAFVTGAAGSVAGDLVSLAMAAWGEAGLRGRATGTPHHERPWSGVVALRPSSYSLRFRRVAPRGLISRKW